MLKIVYKNCCGIDVHKKQVTCTIALTDNEAITTYKTKQFSTMTYDLKNLKIWLADNNCNDVCMESTGKYWIPVYNILEDTCKITLCHPKYVRSILGKKTDKKDSIWIADIFKHGLVQGSFMPPKDIRELRDLMRYRFKLVNLKASEKNRFQNSLTVSNVMIFNILSDTFGKTSMSILSLMLENKTLKIEDIKPLIRKHVKASPDEILKSVEGTFSNYQNKKMQVCLNHYGDVIIAIDDIEKSVIELALPYKEQLNLILTVPGIKETSALVILSEIGIDMSEFADAEKLCSWAGLTPQNSESAGKKKSVRVSRAGVYLKPTLIQCANAAIKDKKCPYFKLRYENIKKRRGHKRAIIAIARMLLSSIYSMLKNNKEFDYSIYEELTNKNFKPKDTKLNISNAIKFLESQGYSVSNLETIPSV